MIGLVRSGSGSGSSWIDLSKEIPQLGTSTFEFDRLCIQLLDFLLILIDFLVDLLLLDLDLLDLLQEQVVSVGAHDETVFYFLCLKDEVD